MKIFAKLSVLFLVSILSASCVETLLVGGTLASVAVATNDKTMGEMKEDFTIAVTIEKEAIKNDIFIDAESNLGVVLLTGNVKSKDQSQKVSEIAFNTTGVKEVLNELKVVDVEARGTISKGANIVSDKSLAKKIRTRLIFARGVKSNNFEVKVNDGTVYLLGIAQNQSELEKVAYIASTTHGARKVISYIKVI